MAQPAYLIPLKRTRLVWDPTREPLDLDTKDGVEFPLLGYVAAGRPVETPEDRERVTIPRHMVRKNNCAPRVRGHLMIDDQIQVGYVRSQIIRML